MAKFKVTSKEMEHISAMAARFGALTQWLYYNPKAIIDVVEQHTGVENSPYKEMDVENISTIEVLRVVPAEIRESVMKGVHKKAISCEAFGWSQNQIIGRENDEHLWDSIEQNEYLLGQAASEEMVEINTDDIERAKKMVRERYGDEVAERLDAIVEKLQQVRNEAKDAKPN